MRVGREVRSVASSPAGGLDLDAIATRLKAATLGPWEWGRDISDARRSDFLWIRDDDLYAPAAAVRDEDGTLDAPSIIITDSGVYPPNDGDADLIAHAPEDIAALLAEVEALRTALRRIGICAKHAGAEGHGDYRDIEADASMTLARGAPERDL